jgi:glucosamine 6-phosphate synthetase-like amidotransferase/phosphosugar isomerase protein
MCGIFGSLDFPSLEYLYDKNKVRGTFSHGFLYSTRKDGSMYIRKGEGIHNMETEYTWSHADVYDIFLGHSQAPTSAVRDFHADTSHPFDSGHYIVAHNGVLENHTQLAMDINVPEESIRVDSQIIPLLLNELYIDDDVYAIRGTCALLKGIFSCWIYSKHTARVYIVRSGSTLYTDAEGSLFSSISTPRSDIPIPEGRILCFTREGLTEVGEFNTDSPFFII